MHQNSPTIRAALVGVLLVTITAFGCSGPVKNAAGPSLRAYPHDTGQSAVHDIQVFREGTRLRMTNTTATSFGPGTLWINQRFSHAVGSLAVGQSVDLDLYDFIDEFGDTFRAGGFFAINDPDPVVLVQYETASDDAMHGLVLVRDDRK